MGVSMRVVELECTDPIELGKFWSAVLESPMGPGVDGVHIGSQGSDAPISLYLVEERGSERSRARIRLWLTPMEGSLADEVTRLTRLGAVIVEERWTLKQWGIGVVVMADPEGNEFCVESSPAEAAEAERRFEAEPDKLDEEMTAATGKEKVAFAEVDRPAE
ncbi:VOC family protein [Streptomyces sp. CAI-85]|uniref:VOC family protein n=1 Tax=Streptomyces sp. CAI-85 TaxID=1472662 RepID=UPI00158703A1|nr:VOC family protein [Streptomyces sp. CAI-85]NUV61455.1 hypothetical protein [Streptomyces sp. CAI-85]